MNDVNAERIVNRIIADLRSRGGLRQEWDQIDEEIQNSIRIKWAAIVLAEANR